MVKEAAQMNGYNIGPVYHGTSKNFRIFKTLFGRAIWFSEDRDKILRGDAGAQGISKILSVFLSAHKVAGWKEYDKLGEYEMVREFDSVKLDDDWIVYSPEQIKLSDLVTYKGKEIIPLSQRFDSSKKDIRY